MSGERGSSGLGEDQFVELLLELWQDVVVRERAELFFTTFEIDVVRAAPQAQHLVTR